MDIVVESVDHQNIHYGEICNTLMVLLVGIFIMSFFFYYILTLQY